jgi:hypothetical protein
MEEKPLKQTTTVQKFENGSPVVGQNSSPDQLLEEVNITPDDQTCDKVEIEHGLLHQETTDRKENEWPAVVHQNSSLNKLTDNLNQKQFDEVNEPSSTDQLLENGSHEKSSLDQQPELKLNVEKSAIANLKRPLDSPVEVEQKKAKRVFKHGNYSQYYGKRNPSGEVDLRLELFKKDWFEGKHCLDIGCNIGHLTYCLARDFGPVTITGIDIDNYLISIARKNVKHYVTASTKDFPKILPARIKLGMTKDAKFPYNLEFVSVSE